VVRLGTFNGVPDHSVHEDADHLAVSVINQNLEILHEVVVSLPKLLLVHGRAGGNVTFSLIQVDEHSTQVNWEGLNNSRLLFLAFGELKISVFRILHDLSERVDLFVCSVAEDLKNKLLLSFVLHDSGENQTVVIGHLNELHLLSDAYGFKRVGKILRLVNSDVHCSLGVLALEGDHDLVVVINVKAGLNYHISVKREHLPNLVKAFAETFFFQETFSLVVDVPGNRMEGLAVVVVRVPNVGDRCALVDLDVVGVVSVLDVSEAVVSVSALVQDHKKVIVRPNFQVFLLFEVVDHVFD